MPSLMPHERPTDRSAGLGRLDEIDALLTGVFRRLLHIEALLSGTSPALASPLSRPHARLLEASAVQLLEAAQALCETAEDVLTERLAQVDRHGLPGTPDAETLAALRAVYRRGAREMRTSIDDLQGLPNRRAVQRASGEAQALLARLRATP